MRETVDGVFKADKLAQKYQQLAELIRPYAAKDGDEAAFNTALQELIKRISEQEQAVRDFLTTRQ